MELENGGDYLTTSMKKSESNWWWINRPYLRKLLILPLILVNREYKRWRNALLNPRKMSKRLSEIEKRFPKKREDLVGRDKEYQLIMSAIGYHVIRDQTLLNLLKGAPPPKFFILKGTTGSGKTLLAEVCIRDGIEYGINKGVNVQPIVVMGSDIFNPLYGQSVLNLSYIFRKAKDVPSIIFFDEFQSIGLRVERPMYGADREDMRIQDAFVEHINRILNSSQRTVVIAATNKFESIREDIRRRAYLIDLDQNITREMLLAVLKAELEKYGWTHLSPNEVLNVLEKAVSTYRQTQLTPFDIIDACNKVRSRKI
ncbi:MAG: AAA family ATPase, partial [Candidatus Methanomethyliaceae archaeon]